MRSLADALPHAIEVLYNNLTWLEKNLRVAEHKRFRPHVDWKHRFEPTVYLPLYSGFYLWPRVEVGRRVVQLTGKGFILLAQRLYDENVQLQPTHPDVIHLIESRMNDNSDWETDTMKPFFRSRRPRLPK
jgi:hypothetical protein